MQSQKYLLVYTRNIITQIFNHYHYYYYYY